MMHRLLMIIPAYRRMHMETAALTVEVGMLRTTLDIARKSTGFAYDVAYERRQALRAIAECETKYANGTVKKMAAIAKDALKSSTLSGDLVRQYEDARVARGTKAALATKKVLQKDFGIVPGTPGEVSIGTNVSAAGGEGGAAKWLIT